MNLIDLTRYLTSCGFQGLKLISSDEETKTHTFKFSDFNPRNLLTIKPTMAGGGKVAVYTIPEIGKIGVSPSNNIVRFIDAGKVAPKPKANDSHLSKTEVPPEIEQGYKKAQVNDGQRVAFMKQLWHHFNTEKFQSRMKEPKFQTSSRFPRVKATTRGCYSYGMDFGPGILWMNTFMWNARLPFFLEVFLHEMCHEASWDIDHNTDHSHQGHGPVWQKWMVHVGLDPRRFDPTDNYEYQDTATRSAQEEKLTEQYGPRVHESEFTKLKKMTQYKDGPAIMEHSGRLLQGDLKRSYGGKGVDFLFLNPGTKRPSAIGWPSMTSFLKSGLSHFYHPR